MTVYVGFLRGINVGGKNKIKMADLKKTLEALGLAQVQTYLQSGNVLFQSEDARETLCPRIEKAISDAVGVAPTVILRTAAELAELVRNCPMTQRRYPKGRAFKFLCLQKKPRRLSLTSYPRDRVRSMNIEYEAARSIICFGKVCCIRS